MAEPTSTNASQLENDDARLGQHGARDDSVDMRRVERGEEVVVQVHGDDPDRRGAGAEGPDLVRGAARRQPSQQPGSVCCRCEPPCGSGRVT